MTLQERLYYLLDRAAQQRMTETECAEMEQLSDPAHPEADSVSVIMHAYFSGISSAKRINAQEPEWRGMLHTIIAVDAGVDREMSTRPVHRVHFLKTSWFKYAATIIILFGIGAYLWNTQNDSRTIIQTKPVPVKKDILPGGQKAILTLADGRTIVLDSAVNGQLAVENGSEVIKKDGQVIYGAGQFNNTSVTFNTMSTPKGGQYQLTLADGTKVWLNAASSITYPTVFNGKTREVKIAGEVYFEVAKNAKMPFVVKTGKENITVLGTSFNVNRYTDEPQGKISLADGSVKVNEKLLQPGQAYLEGKIINTNIAQDVAWKNGAFNFHHVKLADAMRQLERWYDIKVEYDSSVANIEFWGKIGRSLALQELLEGLNRPDLHFHLKGKILYVTK